MSQATDSTNTVNTIKCKDCGADLKFSPGMQTLKCDYCSASNEIKTEEIKVEESNFHEYIKKLSASSEKKDVSLVKCGSCGASTTLPPNVTSCGCPYCDTPLVIKDATHCSIIKPKYLLPFKIERNQAKSAFEKWAASRWFAPNKLKDYARHSAEKLNGVYMPYWTYDTNTNTSYTGERGEYYYETETYKDSEGRTQTRRVRHTRWYSASGQVRNSFDDLLVCASNSLPKELTRELEPWDLNQLVGYDEKFLAGFLSESYQTDLTGGFDEAKSLMEPAIKSSIEQDIGGDEQRINYFNTDYNKITFKHILLPLWISAYKYNNKVYRFTVNARSGEVQGERPYSVWKITLFVLFILVVITGIIILVNNNSGQQN